MPVETHGNTRIDVYVQGVGGRSDSGYVKLARTRNRGRQAADLSRSPERFSKGIYERVKGVATGTSDSVFSFKIGEPDRAYVFESAIDLLSFKMLAKQDKIQNPVLVSMAGLKFSSLKPLADKGFNLYSCVDNDEKGIKFTSDNGLIPCNRILSENNVKDFNELLQLITHNREIAAQKSQAENHAAPINEVKSPAMSKHSRR